MNLLEYEIINDSFLITQQWEVLRGAQYLGIIGGVEIVSYFGSYVNRISGKLTLYINGTDDSMEQIPTQLKDPRIIPVLETLSKIPVHQTETKSGPIEYAIIPFQDSQSGELVIGLPSLDLANKIAREMKIYLPYYTLKPGIRLKARDLQTALEILNRLTITELFYQEQGIQL